MEHFPPAAYRLFQNVKVKNLGIGKIIKIESNECQVCFFDFPDHIRVFNIPPSHLSPLDPKSIFNNRVYIHKFNNIPWQPARYFTTAGSNCIVKINNQNEINIPEAQVFFRYGRPFGSSQHFLKHFIVDSKKKCEIRSKFLELYWKLRSESFGMMALSSSAIELESHQINIIKTVLSDPVQRFLLADEVGLGKTIEAGVLIRQYILEGNEEKGVLVIVPEHLKHQWYTELKDKFGLRDLIVEDDDCNGGIMICTLGEINSISERMINTGMLVIDEAHHFAEFANSNDAKKEAVYEMLVEVASDLRKRLLLLSATPALNNESTYLAMLRILDPGNYNLKDDEAFKQRVKIREEVAELYQYLRPEANIYDLGNYLKLEVFDTDLNEDEIIQENIKELQRLLEISDPSIIDRKNALLSIIRERLNTKYRLHRRVLRNRRSMICEGVINGRSGMELVSFESEFNEQLYDLLVQWRYLCIECDNKLSMSYIFFAFLTAMEEDLKVLLDLINIRKKQTKKLKKDLTEYSLMISTPLVDGEVEILEKMSRVLKRMNDYENEKINELDCLLSKISNENKVVVFTSSTRTADLIYETLKDVYKDEIVRHSVEFNFDNLTIPQWFDFIVNDQCKIIVCDRRAEEGLNLQGEGTSIVHFDVPYSPNRMEQRIGRVDRYGQGGACKSYLIVPENNRIHSDWIKLLNDTFKIFETSIASLQYLINEEMLVFPKILYDEGENYYKIIEDRLGGVDGKIMSELFKRDDIDYTLEQSAIHREWFENYKMLDEDYSENIKKYLADVLHLKLFPPARLAFNVTEQQNTKLDNLNKMIYEDKTYTDHRFTSIIKKIDILRPGNELMDELSRILYFNEDSSNFVTWRYHKDVNAAYGHDMYYFAQVVILPKRLLELQIVSIGYSEEMRLIEECCPVIIRTCWLNEKGVEVEDEVLLSKLKEPFNNSDNGEYHDKDLNYQQLAKIFDNDTAHFESKVNSVYQEFITTLKNNFQDTYYTQLSMAKERCQAKINLINQSANLNISNDEKEYFETMKENLNKIRESISNPEICLLSSGMLILSGNQCDV
jgi:ATP-dependent helicase HepA